MNSGPSAYRGRLAPSPTGLFHLGHARTFWIAAQRAACAGGTLVLRIEDLDQARCKNAFEITQLEDLRWLGLRWTEGPFRQSDRLPLYRAAFDQLRDRGLIYPCRCTRKDIASALSAPHASDEEPIYPGTCRPLLANGAPIQTVENVNWRFRVPDGMAISFLDGELGPQRFVSGEDFGDFPIWRKDDVPTYQLAVVVDDDAMGITEVVRGADLLLSTARQLLLFDALGLRRPDFYHCPLVCDSDGNRLAKRTGALTLQSLRASGATPDTLRTAWV